MVENLLLNDGTQLMNASAIESGDLFLYINGHNLRNVFNWLIDPAKTAGIRYTMCDATVLEFTGYTKLIAVRDEGGGLVTAVLRKGVVSDAES